MEITDRLFQKIQQRYFVAVMCMLGLVLITVRKMTFDGLMRDLIYQGRNDHLLAACPGAGNPDGHNLSTSAKEEFLWGTQMQVYILSAFPLGLFVGRFPAGLATHSFGGKTLFGYSVFVPAMLSTLTPILARTSPYVLMGSRIVDGLFTTLHAPATCYMAARWFPAKDLSFMLAITNLGAPFGCITKYYLKDFMHYTFKKWVSIFYLIGILGVIYSYVWQALVWDDPFENSYITYNELELLAKTVPMYVNDNELQPGWSWPWTSIITSRALWTLSLANAGYNCLYKFVIIILPFAYFPQVHEYSFGTDHYIMSLVYALMGGVMMTASIASDKLVKARRFNITHISKTYYGLSTILGSLVVLGVTHSECMLTSIFLYFFSTVLLLGIGLNVFYPANVSIAPNFVGLNTIVSSMLTLITSPIQIALVRWMTEEGTMKQWKTISYMFAAFSIFTTALFLKWGNCQPQRWNDPRKAKHKQKNEVLPKVPSKQNLNKQGLGNDINAPSLERIGATGDLTSVNESVRTVAENPEIEDPSPEPSTTRNRVV